MILFPSLRTRLAALPQQWDAALVFLAAFAVFAGIGVNMRGFADTGIGGALFHGLDYGYMLFSMPGEPLARFMLKYRLPTVLAAAAPACCAALFFALLRLLGCGRALAFAACAAALLAAAPLMARLDTELDTLLYASAFLSAAAALLLREREFTVSRSAAAALCIGASCWFRSTLLLLPPVLLLFDALRGRYTWRSFPAHAAALLLLPALFLSPWAYMSSKLGGGALLFEKGRADCNILAGALGITMTTEGDVFKLAELPPDTTPQRWALRSYAAQPGEFLSAFARRAAAALSWHWLLWLAFAVAAVRFWKDRAFQAAALLACYWLFLHTALMPVEPRYFIPLLPLLAAGGVAAFLPRPGGNDPVAFAPRWLALGFFPAAAAALLAASLCSAYPFLSARKPEPVDSGSDAWRVSAEGMRRMGSGDTAAALGFTASALKQDPRWPELYLNHARALLCARPALLAQFAAKAPSWGEDRAPRFAYFPVLGAAGKLYSGDILGGETALARLENYWKGGIVYFRSARTPREKELERKLYATDTALYDVAVTEALAPLPACRRLEILRLLSRAGLSCAGLARDIDSLSGAASCAAPDGETL